ncbi:MAG: polysaccharide deacetylase family protein [Rhodospirillales bacterium]|nr:polysaccharide deacetylase family protein [Rhodospirillales bacterium]
MAYEPPITIVDKLRSRYARARKAKPHTLANTRSIVSFSFDDFPRSAVRVGGRILAAHGVVGTYYVAGGMIGRRGESGEFATHEDVCDVIANGHELACHSHSHQDGMRVPASAMMRDIDRNARHVARTIGGYRLQNFAYPYGRVSRGLQVAVGARFTSARGVLPGINHGTIDLTYLHSSLLYAAPEYQAAAHRMIEENVLLGGWLIFLTHDVGPHPSPYGCTAPQLDAAVRAALASGAEVLTVAAALDRIGVPKPEPSRLRDQDRRAAN